MRFQMEKEILERVQGHPNIVELLGSGEGDSTGFIPPMIRDRVENDFMILELLDMSLEERLKGARQKQSTTWPTTPNATSPSWKATCMARQ